MTAIRIVLPLTVSRRLDERAHKVCLRRTDYVRLLLLASLDRPEPTTGDLLITEEGTSNAAY